MRIINFDKIQVANIGIPQGLNKYATSNTSKPSLMVYVIKKKIATIKRIKAIMHNTQDAVLITREKIPMNTVSKSQMGATKIIRKNLRIFITLTSVSR